MTVLEHEEAFHVIVITKEDNPLTNPPPLTVTGSSTHANTSAKKGNPTNTSNKKRNPTLLVKRVIQQTLLVIL